LLLADYLETQEWLFGHSAAKLGNDHSLNNEDYLMTANSISCLSPIAPAVEGFTHHYETLEGVRIHYVTGGNAQGETLVLLAGFPESWYSWRKVMPALGEHYRIIAPDLPGQGDSDKPLEGYDTKSVATKVRSLLQRLEVTEYYLAAHDVGAWVAYPYAAMFGDEIKKLAILDAGIPGVTLPDAVPHSTERGWRTWHFAFHAIPDLPEALIAGKERVYLEWFLRRKTAAPDAFSEEDINEYLRTFTKSGGVRAGLAYYRALSVSAAQNAHFKSLGKLKTPVLAIGAEQGSIADMATPLRPFFENVKGTVIAKSGHFLQEEQPEAVEKALRNFFDL
jgi:pimeloyl-ACP methyl ester carboxylesterase